MTEFAADFSTVVRPTSERLVMDVPASHSVPGSAAASKSLVRAGNRHLEPREIMQRLEGMRFERATKRVIDVCGAATLLILLAPLLLTLIIIVRLDSEGPVLYRRRVVGRHGRPIDALKFRTMAVDGDRLLSDRPDLQAKLREAHKLDEQDPRITRSGRWLRPTSLDELPQLWNVLLGDMSLVGPRMISPPELERYGDNSECLLAVRPGVTGLWQVSGRSSLPPAERVRLDLLYIAQFSIRQDILLLLRTIPAVLLRRGAC